MWYLDLTHTVNYKKFLRVSIAEVRLPFAGSTPLIIQLEYLLESAIVQFIL